MKLIELGKTKKVRVSFENVSELIVPNYNKLETDLNTGISAINENRSFTLELLLPFHASYYAVLGAKYTQVTGSDSLHIEARYLDANTENYENTIAYNKKTVYKGLSKEYVETVLKTAIEYSQYNNVPSGKIVFDAAACCEVGSSTLLFRIVTKIVLHSLLNEQYPVSDSAIKCICEKYLLERINRSTGYGSLC